MHNRLLLVLVAASLCVLAGCARTATITRTDQSVVEAKIVSSDAVSIKVKEDDDAEEIVIPRAQIADIDHPGNVRAMVGGSFALLGAVPFGMGIASMADSSSTAGVALLLIGTPVFGTGLGAMIKGLVIWTDSTEAAAAPAAESTSWVVTPMPVTDGVEVGTGVGLTVSF